MNTPERRWQGSFIFFHWGVVVTAGYRMRADARSLWVNFSWARRRVEQ